MDSHMDGNQDLMALWGLNATHGANGENEYEDDNDDDFYGDDSSTPAPNEDAKPGAQNKQIVDEEAQKKLAEEKKAENQRQADLLRAKLLARRQNTPVKQHQQPPRQNTPSKTPAPAPAASALPAQQQSPNTTMAAAPDKKPTAQQPMPPTSVQSLEALFAESKAHADAKIAALAAARQPQTKPTPTPTPAHTAPPAKETSAKESTPAKDISAKESAPAPQHSKQQPNAVQDNGITTQNAAKQEQPTPLRHEPLELIPAKRPTNLSDPYYADLPAWLEMTGFHDPEFRNKKLHTYKERRALEEEAARIAARLEKLKEAEQQEMQQMRLSTPMPAPSMAPPPPPLPAMMPTNGVKRGRSPEATFTVKNAKRREDNGDFPIRRASDTADARRRTPPASERRTAYPEARRRSIDERSEPSRDRSLERRQSYYRRDGDSPREPLPPPPPPPQRYDHYNYRDIRTPRLSYNNAMANNERPSRPQYRGSTALDLKKGGVRYFMIKSWNIDNVLAAQRDGLWATQQSNEDLLTEAFKTSRHVILLFSVNKSKGFQGSALMTSAPDPTLPKPTWTAKLRWSTSGTFTLRWLAVTEIHFRAVGDLYNTYNSNEDGEILSVIVGKDGQEISPDAGMGVVWALDEAEARNQRNDDLALGEPWIRSG